MKIFATCAALCAALLLAAAPDIAADDDGADQRRFNQRLRGLWSGGGSVFGGDPEPRPGTSGGSWLDDTRGAEETSPDEWSQARKRAEDARKEGIDRRSRP